VRWLSLFDDLEAQLDREERAGLDSELAERVRAERAAVGLGDRLLAHHGARLALTLAGGRVQGVVRDVAPQWVLVVEDRTPVLVPTAAVVTVSGLARAVAPEPGTVLRRLGISHVLRGLARDRAAVTVHAGRDVLAGTIDRVGADHLDLALHDPGEARRPGAVSAVVAVAFAHLQQVRGGAG
jgi:uncharacterized protein YjeT (DUF2065 family)